MGVAGGVVVDTAVDALVDTAVDAPVDTAVDTAVKTAVDTAVEGVAESTLEGNAVAVAAGNTQSHCLPAKVDGRDLGGMSTHEKAPGYGEEKRRGKSRSRR